jgi:Ca2+-binding RTX toxin-like protein
VLALTTAAFAVSVSGDGTLIGSSGSDTLSAGDQNDIIFGLGGQDFIKAGNGNDVIDGDGKCPAGIAAGDYPHGLPGGSYCQHGPIPGDPGDFITAGEGNDIVYGGGGPNTTKLGNGTDTVYGGPKSNNINVGDGPDTIHAGGGPDTIKTGSGTGTIYAQNGASDNITCSPGNHYTVYADKIDTVKACFKVLYTPPPAGDKATSRRSHHKRSHRRHARGLHDRSE